MIHNKVIEEALGIKVYEWYKKKKNKQGKDRNSL